MKTPMLLVSHKAGAYPSDLPGLIKGRSFESPLTSPLRPPVVTSRGRNRVMSRDVNKMRPRQRGFSRRKQPAVWLDGSRRNKEKRPTVCLSTLLPDRATIPSTTADKCRQLWADAAVRLVMGGGVWLAAGREAIGQWHWLRISWAW